MAISVRLECARCLDHGGRETLQQRQRYRLQTGSVRILDKLSTAEERTWYVQQTSEHGWSRDVLLHHIDTGLYSRQGKTITNFLSTLPPQQSDLAQRLINDPYRFDFLTLSTDAHEAELRRGLLRHLREFLIELGVGFAYVDSNSSAHGRGHGAFGHAESWSSAADGIA